MEGHLLGGPHPGQEGERRIAIGGSLQAEAPGCFHPGKDFSAHSESCYC